MVFSTLIVTSVFFRGTDASNDDSNLWPLGDKPASDDSMLGDGNLGGDRVGLPAPNMGGQGDPCRNSWWGECNWWEGLSCHNEYHGSFMTGTCQGGSQSTGGENQQCRFWGTSCDEGLIPSYIGGTDGGLFGKGKGCYCERRLYGEAKAPSNAPAKVPALGAGLEALRDATSPADTKVGMPAPIMGGYGQPCRNTPGDECNSGLVCFKYSSDGTSQSGYCSYNSNPNWVAREGQKCGAYADSGKPTKCDTGLFCKHQKLLGTANAGWTSTCEKHQQPQYAQKGDVCGRYAPLGKPYNCAPGLTCKTRKLLGTADAGYTAMCEAENQYAQYGQPCGGSASGKQCDASQGLQCMTDRSGGLWISTCQYRLYGNTASTGN
jgi:hypothetical protein